MNTTPYQKYQQSSVQTASPAQLVVMLYDAAIRFVRQGIDSIENRDLQNANRYLLKGQNVIHELTAALDMRYDLSSNLSSIYEYMLHLLITANVKKSKEPAVEALSYLTDLREAWAQAAKQVVSIPANHG